MIKWIKRKEKVIKMVQYENEYNLLIGKHKIKGYDILIIMLTDSIHAYIVEQNEVFNVYLAETQSGRKPNAELFRTFETKEQALEFAREFWSCREEVQAYVKTFDSTRLKNATPKQISATYGEATNYGEATWFFAKRNSYFRLKDLLKQKTKKSNSVIEDFKNNTIDDFKKVDL